jgi:rsbT co-antagonist protein RsbR
MVESIDLATIETEQQLQEAIGVILAALRDADGGKSAVLVELPYGDSEPLAMLAARVNMMLESLVTVREETLIAQSNLEEQIGTIEKQRAAIRELSTPIIEVWAGVVCVPIVGILDSSRASEMTSALLNAVVEKKALFTIIDITGIDAMDTGATDHFLRMARAVRLLGAECVLSGVNPNVARTVTHMGIDLTGVRTHRTLREALQYYVGGARPRVAAPPKPAGSP